MAKDLQTMRHSAAHVLAQAVLKFYPQTKLGIGPATEEGFYYDFDFKKPISEEDLPKIEKEMKKITDRDLRFEKREVSVAESKKIFKKEPYKLELIEDIAQGSGLRAQGNKVTIYSQGDFVDLCSGPHVRSTKEIGPFRLQVLAGAYWRGSEKNPMLTRIYGTCFRSQKELDKHLKILEEIKKRDHRKLGPALDLYSLPSELGGGLPVWHPKGATVRGEIEDFWKEVHQKRGYELVYSPHLANLEIWKRSGHFFFYRENMYSPIKIENQYYMIKPMNCPFHVQIFKSKLRSYRDLPIRYAELGTVYRYERSGVLHGLTRVRGFTQDDAHIFCREDQLQNEIVEVLKLADLMMKTFHFSYKIYLSTRPKKSLGTNLMWEKATSALKSALEKLKLKYEIDPGEGIFYGPKIDIKLQDALGREWQGPTIQVDFNFPEKFDLNYIDQRGAKRKVVMIHRTVLGSLERFMGCLIEHHGGAFPVWLSPTQAIVLNIGKAHLKYAQQIVDKLRSEGIRIEVDFENKTMAKKIRDAQSQKIPYMLVVGDRELKKKTINVRDRSGKMKEMKLENFIKILKEEITKKK